MPSLPDLPQKFVPNDLRLKTESLSTFIIGAELHCGDMRDLFYCVREKLSIKIMSNGTSHPLSLFWLIVQCFHDHVMHPFIMKVFDWPGIKLLATSKPTGTSQLESTI